MKRICSFLLIAVLIITASPALYATNAEFAGGSGTEADPYIIATQYHLNNVRNHLNAHFKMAADIVFEEGQSEKDDLEKLTYGFEPIGSSASTAFAGTFDGNGHCIKNLYIRITSSGDLYGGLFGYNKGTVKNLGVDGEVKGYSDRYAYIGGIVGYNSGTVSRCHYSGTVLSSSVSSFEIDAGGIAGDNYGTIERCFNSGTISAIMNSNQADASAGGIAGYNFGDIKQCYNTGAISAVVNGNQPTASAGGIAGYNENKGTVINCYNSGEIHSSAHYVARSGGIVGYNNEWTYDAKVMHCYNIGAVTAESNTYDLVNGTCGFAGGIIGEYTNYGSSTNCYYLDNVSKGTGKDYDTARKCSAKEMKRKSTFEEFDFETVWVIGGHHHRDGYEYPVFQLIENVDYVTEYAFDTDGHWTKCNVCERQMSETAPHLYDHNYDAACVCGHTREVDILMGDVNVDGKNGVADAVILLRAIDGNAPAISVEASDMDKDGVLTTADVVAILQLMLK